MAKTQCQTCGRPLYFFSNECRRCRITVGDARPCVDLTGFAMLDFANEWLVAANESSHGGDGRSG